MMPLARPRREVGNSSGPYTPRAGTTIAPVMAAATDSPHIGQPPRRTMATVSSDAGDDAGGADEPPTAGVGEAAADHQADAAGGVGEDAEHRDPQRREALLVAEELVEELRGRRGEQRQEERGRRQQPEALAVPRHPHVGVGGVVPAALGQVARREPHEGEQEERRHHHQAPPAVADVGERQGGEAEPGAERAGGADEGDGEGARPGRHLLGGDDGHEHAAGGGQARARTSGRCRASGGRAPGRSARRCTQPANAQPEQGAPPPVPIGQRGEGEGAEHADPHGRQRGGLVGLAGRELLGGVRDRLREQRADVAEHERQRAERAERGGRVGVGRLGRRPPRLAARRRVGWRAPCGRARRTGTATPSGRAGSRSSRRASPSSPVASVRS